MRRKDFKNHFNGVEEIVEAVKATLGLDDREIVQLAIEILSLSVYNATNVQEFTGCIGGEMATKNGKELHYNFSLGTMAKENNERLKALCNYHTELHKQGFKKNN